MQRAVQNYVKNPSIEMQLKKLNHGLSIQIKNNTVILDVAVQLDSGSTAKEAEVALRNALSIAIKAHQPKIYIREKAFDLLPDSNPIKNSAKYMEGAGVFKIDVYAQPNPRIDNVDINSPVIKEVMEYLFDSNFQTAKKIINKKGGYAQAAPSGTFFNTTSEYVSTMSEQSLLKRLSPQGKALNAAEDFYINVDKYIVEDGGAKINPQWWRGWIHDIMQKANDPLYVVVARDGAVKAMDYFTNTTQGKKYIKELIRRSDDPDVRAVLNNEEDLLKYLKSAEYEVGRLQGNQTRKILRGGQEITEEQAGQMIRNADGSFNFPDYEVDLTMGAETVREFISTGGFLNGEDWLELSQKYAVLSSKSEKYFGDFYNKIKEVFDKDIVQLDLGPRTQAFNNNPNLTVTGQMATSALSKFDEELGNAYSILLAKPSDWLNRDPMFRWSFYTLAEDLMPFMTEDVKKEFIVGAKTWIDGSELYENLLKKADLPAGENSIETLEQASLGNVQAQQRLTRIESELMSKQGIQLGAAKKDGKITGLTT